MQLKIYPKAGLGTSQGYTKTASKNMTVWKLYLELEECSEDKLEEVQDLVQVPMNWAIAAACRSSVSMKTSQMAYFFLAVTLPLRDTK